MKIISNPSSEWVKRQLILIGFSCLIGIILLAWGIYQEAVIAILVVVLFILLAYRYIKVLNKNKYIINLSRSNLTVKTLLFHYTLFYDEIEEIEIEKMESPLGQQNILRLTMEGEQKEFVLDSLSSKDKSVFLRKLREKTHKRIHHI